MPSSKFSANENLAALSYKSVVNLEKIAAASKSKRDVKIWGAPKRPSGAADCNLAGKYGDR